MKPAPFDYAAPSDIAETTSFLAAHGSDARLLAGGQSLMPVLNMRLSRPRYVVDLNQVSELDYIRAGEAGLRIGAMTRHHSLLESEVVREKCALLWRAIPYIGHSAIRYRGTIGGSIVHADPSAEIPAVMVALGAEFTLTAQAGSRTIPASEFFLTYFTTVAEPTEVLTEIRVPPRSAATRVAVCELARRHGDFAIAGIALAAEPADGGLGDVRLCGFGVGDAPRRLAEVEQLVSGERLTDELLAEAGRRASSTVEPEADMHASGEYRAEVTGVLAIRALREAMVEPRLTDSGGEDHG